MGIRMAISVAELENVYHHSGSIRIGIETDSFLYWKCARQYQLVFGIRLGWRMPTRKLFGYTRVSIYWL